MSWCSSRFLGRNSVKLCLQTIVVVLALPSQPKLSLVTQSSVCFCVDHINNLGFATADSMLAILHVQTDTSSIVLHITFITLGLQSASLAMRVSYFLHVLYCVEVLLGIGAVAFMPCFSGTAIGQDWYCCVTVAECITTFIVMQTWLVGGVFASEVGLHKLSSQSAYWVYWWRVNNPLASTLEVGFGDGRESVALQGFLL